MIDAHRAQTMRSVQERETRITTLAVERGFFKRILNWFRIRALKADIATLYKADSHYSSALDQTIARVRSLLNSTEFAGAAGPPDLGPSGRAPEQSVGARDEGPSSVKFGRRAIA
jgi:hypothetical protein